MTRSYVEAPATHFRLKPETWAIIAEEYKNGATAKDIGAKWKVAPSSVYRYACRDGFTKKRMGDARARAHARMVEEEEASARSMHPVGSRALKALFHPAPADDAAATDPAELARAATLASGRAMKGRLWAEAKALAGLAETYARLGEREAKAAEAARVTIETMDLQLLFDILFVEKAKVRERFGIWGEGEQAENYELKSRFWRQWYLPEVILRKAVELGDRRAWQLERQIRDLGAEPVPGDTRSAGPAMSMDDPALQQRNLTA
ncbi:MAG: hypothetical protein KKA16_12685 [Alphaproteobacteria bacterium]|nr:hypothetical protein [Alphaproteobacteria bacterium]MBU2380237.1 hypothetical protein [Alphaproteobacteria bacterium]